MYIRFNSNSCKTLLIYLISFVLIYTPTLTFASAAEKWELVAQSYDRAKNTVNVEARKIGQAAANSSRYKVEVPVNSATLGSSVKTLLKGGLAVAAITALVEGVGWIIEEGSKIMKPDPTQPPNYQYIYKIDGLTYSYSSYTDASYQYFLKLNKKDPSTYDKYISSSPDPDCGKYWSNSYWCGITIKFSSSHSNPDAEPSETSVSVQKVVNPDFDESQQPRFIPVSDTELGNEVLGKGTEPNSSTAPQNDIINDAYNPNNPTTEGGAETDTALDAAPPLPDTEPSGNSKPKPNVDTDGDGVPDTYDPDKPSVGEEFELPAFCSWAVTVCEWYTQYKQDSKKAEKHREEQEKPFFQKVKDWLDWTKEESPPDKDPEKPEIKDPDLSIGVTNYIQFGSQCPVDRQIPLSMGGQTLNLVISYQPLCTVAQQFRPAVILMAFLAGAFIITNTGRRAETGD